MTDLTVHPGTGEVLEHLDQQPADTLAEALDAVHRKQAELKRWGDALEGELRQRLKVRQSRLVVFGDWEVEATVSRRSEWDGAELEPVLKQLVDDGVVRARDVADVITRDPVVSASRATTLLRRLTGDAHAAVAATCTWREKPGKLTVARSIALPAPADVLGAPALAPSPADSSPVGDGRPAPSTTYLDPEELFA